jgi:hypothetical protein
MSLAVGERDASLPEARADVSRAPAAIVTAARLSPVTDCETASRDGVFRPSVCAKTGPDKASFGAVRGVCANARLNRGDRPSGPVREGHEGAVGRLLKVPFWPKATDPKMGE